MVCPPKDGHKGVKNLPGVFLHSHTATVSEIRDLAMAKLDRYQNPLSQRATPKTVLVSRTKPKKRCSLKFSGKSIR